MGSTSDMDRVTRPTIKAGLESLRDRAPVVLVDFIQPRRGPPFDKVGVALSALERKYFAPGTPANELYQIVLSPWAPAGVPMVAALVVFPGEHLIAFADSLRRHGLALTRGVPVLSGAAGAEAMDVAGVVLEQLGVRVEARTYFFSLLGHDGAAIREAMAMSALARPRPPAASGPAPEGA
jgi:hypothetical protein